MPTLLSDKSTHSCTHTHTHTYTHTHAHTLTHLHAHTLTHTFKPEVITDAETDSKTAPVLNISSGWNFITTTETKNEIGESKS